MHHIKKQRGTVLSVSKKNDSLSPEHVKLKDKGLVAITSNVSSSIEGAPNFNLFAVDQAGGGGGAASKYLFGHN